MSKIEDAIAGRLESIVEEELERFGVPGAAVAVTKGGEVVMSRGFGLRDVEGGLPVTKRTRFPIGSTTKAFTATMIGSLVDEGLVGWDRPVREYLPHFQLKDPIATQQLTLRDMLSHRSGLARHDQLMLMYGSSKLSRADLVHRLRYLEPNRSLREEWQYNNLIYMAAGHVAEVVLGCTWEEAVADRILEPLRMTSTNFSIDELRRSDDHSLPYGEIEGEVREVPFRVIEMIGPAGSINSTIEDMTAWVTLNVERGAFGGRQVVDAATMQQIHQPAIVVPAPQQWEESSVVGYALGWIVESYRGRRLLWHNGGVDGFKALVSFVPGDRVGVVVLANRFPSMAPEAIAYRLTDELLGLSPTPWGERLDELTRTMEASEEEARQQRETRTKAAPPTHPLDKYAGRYSHPGYGEISFQVRDGKLTADLHDLHITLKHRHYNTWDGHEEKLDIRIPFLFTIDLEGEISKVEAGLEDEVDPIVFVRVPDED